MNVRGRTRERVTFTSTRSPIEEVVWALSWDDILPKNYELNDNFAFIELGYIAPQNPDTKEVANNLALLRGAVSGEGLDIQMKIDLSEKTALGDSYCLYSRQDVQYPIILIPAHETTVSLRTLSTSGTAPVAMELTALKIPDTHGEWQPTTTAERDFYNYRQEGDWFKLTFPENRTNEFREIGLTISTVERQAPQWPFTTTAKLTRSWIFIQLPWTDDCEVLNHIPLTGLREYLDDTTHPDGTTIRPNGLPKIDEGEIPLTSTKILRAFNAINYLNQNQQNESCIQTFSPMKVLMKNYGIDHHRHPTPSFVVLPAFDVQNFQRKRLEDIMGRFSQEEYGLITQIKFAHLPSTHSLYQYSFFVEQPQTLLIPSTGETVTMRGLPFSDAIPISSRLATMRVIDNDQSRLASEEDVEFYSYSNDGEWTTLTFPPNPSDEFRQVVLFLDMVKGEPGTRGYRTYIRGWRFVQLPCTDDPDIFNHLPAY